MSGVWREGTKMEKKNVMVELKAKKAESDAQARRCGRRLRLYEACDTCCIFGILLFVCFVEVIGFENSSITMWILPCLLLVGRFFAREAADYYSVRRQETKREFDEWCNQKKLDLFFEYSIAQSRFPCADEPSLSGAMLEKALKRLECAQDMFHTFARVADGLRTNPNTKIPDDAEPAKSENA